MTSVIIKRARFAACFLPVPILAILFFVYALPAVAQEMREFKPIPRGELYDKEFLNDFYDSLGYRPQGLTLVDESETVRLMTAAGVLAMRGDADNAVATLDILPESVSSAFPFLTTMHEDLLVPEILNPWYQNEDARKMLFTFYQDAWLPHPEYGDDFKTFREDTAGRASRRDPDIPAVWILGHIVDYGYAADQSASQDDPFLFLWDLLTGVSYYAQRCGFYNLKWDQYNPDDYKKAVVKRVGEMIKAAHDEAARKELSRGFWGQIIDRYHPFEPPTEGVQSTGEMPSVPEEEPASQNAEGGITVPPTKPEMTSSEHETTQPDYSGLFKPPSETAPSDDLAVIENKIEVLSERLKQALEESKPTAEIGIEQNVPVETESEVQPENTELGPEVGVETPAQPSEVEEPGTTGTEEVKPEEQPATTPETATEPETVTEPETESPEENIPDEFLQPAQPTEPEIPVEEETPPAELGNYAKERLSQISGELVKKIGDLGEDLGKETIDLVVLYNDVNVSEETIKNAETRYLAKQEAFLAGLAVWDRFDMENYSLLTLPDFNQAINARIRAPYDELKAGSTKWSQYESFEKRFDEAFAQIEDGLTVRRDDKDVLSAEAAALTAFLGEYNDLIKEIEDLLSGTVTEPPKEEVEE